MGNWEHKIHTDAELKEIVRAVYDCKTFTSLQCKDDMMMVFMPAMFIGSRPSAPPLGNDNQINRKNKLQYIEDCLTYEKETTERENFLKNIGMLYEDYSKALPGSFNGYPIFASCKIMSIDDTKRFIEMYRKYEKMREDFEKEF